MQSTHGSSSHSCATRELGKNTLTPERRILLWQKSWRCLPSGSIAFRLGDFSLEVALPEVSKRASEEKEEEGLSFHHLFQHKGWEQLMVFRRCSLTSPTAPVNPLVQRCRGCQELMYHFEGRWEQCPEDERVGGC